MEKYEVYYKDTLIGWLQVNPTVNQYRYDPEPTGTAAVKNRACLLRVMENGSEGWAEPIPFFQNRLYNMKRNGLKVVNYQTDYFTMVQIQE